MNYITWERRRYDRFNDLIYDEYDIETAIEILDVDIPHDILELYCELCGIDFETTWALYCHDTGRSGVIACKARDKSR